MLYCQSQQWLFTHVSRTGGTSLRDALRTACPDARRLLTQHANLADARAQLGTAFEQTFCFAFVRNPWERLVSWYAMIGQTQARVHGANYSHDPQSPHWQEFASFLSKWSAERMWVDGRERARHSQWAQLCDANNHLLTQALGRFENYQQDRVRICTQIGVAIDQSAPEALNSASHLPYPAYYSRQTRELVAQAYSDDVERFGYEFLAG